MFYESTDCCKSYTNLVQGLQAEFVVTSFPVRGPEEEGEGGGGGEEVQESLDNSIYLDQHKPVTATPSNGIF